MSNFPTPPPDTKDWTWVLERPCPECGFNSPEYGSDAFASRIDGAAIFWQSLLESDGPELRERPAPTKWSPMEYACHIRDILALFDGRFDQMLTQDAPEFDDWSADDAAAAGDYAHADSHRVAEEITANAAAVSLRLRLVQDDEWELVGDRGDGVRFTIDSLARYLLHELVHHEWDVS
ncbi:DinB family protein [Spelaeicoccus albus]|uniref:DinB-like domain-containing protein n=1 Tax=Spelaeicoccus albus TaxID=1280376 RepID=A0A7Z0A9Y2_9MICO|nr:DinB family protein [Spelaeicoccus albus]NYI66255.1 hypothetical protein [Spelaeicoccus albus]